MTLSLEQQVVLRFLGAMPNIWHSYWSVYAAVLTHGLRPTNGVLELCPLVKRGLVEEGPGDTLLGPGRLHITDKGLAALRKLERDQ